jgi:hypothetical protein
MPFLCLRKTKREHLVSSALSRNEERTCREVGLVGGHPRVTGILLLRVGFWLGGFVAWLGRRGALNIEVIVDGGLDIEKSAGRTELT